MNPTRKPQRANHVAAVFLSGGTHAPRALRGYALPVLSEVPPSPLLTVAPRTGCFGKKIRCRKGTWTRFTHDARSERGLERRGGGKRRACGHGFRSTRHLVFLRMSAFFVDGLRRACVWRRTTSPRRVTWRRWLAVAACAPTRGAGRKTRWCTATDTAAT